MDAVATAPDEAPADRPGDDPDAPFDHYVVGVSFTKDRAGLDYAVDAVCALNDGGDPFVETVQPAASERYRYVRFVHPPDMHFDASSFRARLLVAIERERLATEEPDAPSSRFAVLWKQS